MNKKILILIGRTFVATFLLVNFFNIIPFNFESNAWYVQITMLLVDTASLLLIGLASLKIVSFLSINNNSSLNFTEDNLSEKMNNEISKNDKHRNNLSVINKFSNFLIYFFISIALIQTFVVINGLSTLDIAYSEKVIQIEKNYENANSQILSQSIINSENDKENDFKLVLEQQLNQKIKAVDALEKYVNNTKFILFKNAMKVFLMSIVWAYGFFKLANFQ